MRLRMINIAVLLILFSTTTVFAHSAIVQISGENKYKAIRLTPEIYNNANSDLSDILIKDSKGEAVVPYFINTGFQHVYQGHEYYPMELINSYTKNSSFYFDYKLAAEQESDIIATSINFSTNSTNFAKLIDVYGSYDSLHWEFVQNDKLYSIDGKEKLDIEFNKSQKYTHYRFEIANNLEKVSFNTVNLVYNINANEKIYFIESFTPSFNIEEKDKTTFIKIDGLKNLRLCDITIETNSMFKRIASAPLKASKELYNLSINDESYTDTTLPVNWQTSQDDVYVITIANNDDKPIVINGITVRYYADEIVFEGNPNENYLLYFGADSSKSPPVYDIASYKDEILKGPIDKATLGAISYEIEKESTTELDYKFIFNIVVIVITILLGCLILLGLKRKPER